MVNPTAYTKTNPNAGSYGLSRKNNFALLLQNGAYLLLQNGIDKLILESSLQSKSNYIKTNPNPTNYVII